VVLALVVVAPAAQARADAYLPTLRILAPLADIAADGAKVRPPTVPSPRWGASSGLRPVCCRAVDASAAWRSLDLPPPSTR